MPSIFRQSSSFSSNKIALISQAYTEDSSGLVTMNLVYACSSANNDYWSKIFSINSDPPIWPDAINASNLQKQKLSLSQRAISKQNGIVEIAATYYGSLQSALTAKNKRERVDPLSVDFSTDIYTWRIGLKTKTIEYIVAITDNSRYVARTPTIESLITSYSRIQILGTSYLTTQNSISSFVKYLISIGNLSVEQERSINIYTPSVSVVTTRFYVATKSSSI